MSIYSYTLSSSAKKSLRRFDKRFQRQIFDDIEAICKLRYPAQSPNVKKLQGEYEANTYRLRSGEYRAIFRIDGSVLKIERVFNRQAGPRRYK